ncbi:hypothetical protein [Halioxenophilus aromaticivorans]|uniref:Cytochrome c domain-containing protein n=1 Tax=Halioxenophilus aromaticivorans TaxID=1306992 RepID=A0AAV3U6I7_9ALTE
MLRLQLLGSLGIALAVPLAQFANASSSVTEATTSAAAEEVSFNKKVVPILKRRCAVCHITGNEPGNMALTPNSAYDSLVNQRSVQSNLLRVNPGAPSESYIVHKLQGSQAEAGGIGDRMPYMAPPLSSKQLQLIETWISQGAQNN